MSFGAEKVRTYKSGGTIIRGGFVKFGADDNTVVQCGLSEDMIGVAQNDSLVGERCEVARPGDGGEIILAATLARGAFVKSDAAGKAIAATTGARAGACLVESGVAGDIVGCEVVLFQHP